MPGTVFDSNVLVSALLFEHSVPRQAFDRATARWPVLLSIETLSALASVLSRPKFDRYLHPEERERFLVGLVRGAELVEVRERIRECRDPRDDVFLEVAVAGRAERIITGDEDLLVLHPFRGIPILGPAEYLALP
ncbi:MAG: putative toxin-antitoxin system toxin component, PIN family [Gemmatimonadetes bacterium]|nr:putative toxin-antitoxin system toxin component, PIN family [Gemmatimonadota bacterium]